MKKLNTFVHAYERTEDGGPGRSQQFGPGDDVPEWARKVITNPKVWVGEDDEPEPKADIKQPPRKGPGSGGPSWIEFAKSKGVTEKFDSKEKLIGHLEDNGLIEKE